MFLDRLYWSAYLAFHMRGQRRYPFRPPEAVRRDQSRRVRRMVAYAYRHVPYYTETMNRLGLTPADFQAADDLAKLPLLTRGQLQRDPERFASDALPREECLMLRTAGSTGTPCQVYHDLRALFQSAAHVERERAVIAKLIGKRFGYREIMIAPVINSTAEVREHCYRHAWFPPGLRVHRRYLSIYEPPQVNLAAINEFQPDLLYSYGAYLALLFGYLHDSGAPFHRPKAVVYSSDNVPPSARRLILEEFRIPLFSWYQALEAVKIGFECEEHKGIHLNIDLYPLRIVDDDGRALPQGETGDVVVSNLVNRAMVLLNYRLGDLAALLPEPCPCGRSLPLLSFLPGRSNDLLVLPSGQTLHPVFVHDVLVAQEPIWQYRVVQRAPAHFEIVMVVAETCNRPQLAQVIVRRFAEKFGQEVKTDVTFVPSIPFTAGGKHRTVISLVQQDRIALAEANPEG